MITGKVHVVGAGLAGLAAATALADKGFRVEVSEAAAQAGGRCRSYFDAQLGLTIDNGNHMVLSGNRSVAAYLTRLGAQDRLAGPAETEITFVDARDGASWTIRPNPGPLPWWILDKARGVPGAGLSAYLALAPLLSAKDGRRVDQTIRCKGPLWERLMEPFLLAALNTAPEGGSAKLAGQVMRESLARGGAAYRPRIPHPTLAGALIDPALSFLTLRGAHVRLGRRLRRLQIEGGRVTSLDFADETTEPVPPGDLVVLAVPPWVAEQLLPDLTVPDAFCGIVNGHFRIAPPPSARLITGVIGAAVEWIFCFEDRVSVTVSGADRLIGEPAEALAERLWADVARVLHLSPELPPHRIVKEKRATFAATPEQDARRPAPGAAGLENLVLAGDWTNTGLPATIEGALRSGFVAADWAQRRLANA
jgi:squalene-associated FAD-dependent desaturase